MLVPNTKAKLFFFFKTKTIFYNFSINFFCVVKSIFDCSGFVVSMTAPLMSDLLF